jgi:hypothetical protein
MDKRFLLVFFSAGNILEKILFVSKYCITCGVCNYAWASTLVYFWKVSGPALSQWQNWKYACVTDCKENEKPGFWIFLQMVVLFSRKEDQGSNEVRWFQKIRWGCETYQWYHLILVQLLGLGEIVKRKKCINFYVRIILSVRGQVKIWVNKLIVLDFS